MALSDPMRRYKLYDPLENHDIQDNCKYRRKHSQEIPLRLVGYRGQQQEGIWDLLMLHVSNLDVLLLINKESYQEQ